MVRLYSFVKYVKKDKQNILLHFFILQANSFFCNSVCTVKLHLKTWPQRVPVRLNWAYYLEASEEPATTQEHHPGNLTRNVFIYYSEKISDYFCSFSDAFKQAHRCQSIQRLHTVLWSLNGCFHWCLVCTHSQALEGGKKLHWSENSSQKGIEQKHNRRHMCTVSKRVNATYTHIHILTKQNRYTSLPRHMQVVPLV